METITASELKANFSKILERVIAGEEIDISYGKKKEIVARLIAQTTVKKARRKLGILEGKGTVQFGTDFKMTETDFLDH